MHEDLRRQVSLGCRVLGAADQGDLIWGHVSARDPDGRGAWMKASGLGLEEVRPDDVVLEVLEGSGRRHAEYPIHTQVLRARPDVGSVIHTHSPAAAVLAALGAPLRALSHEASLFVPPELARFTLTATSSSRRSSAMRWLRRSPTATRACSSTTASWPRRSTCPRRR